MEETEEEAVDEEEEVEVDAAGEAPAEAGDVAQFKRKHLVKKL